MKALITAALLVFGWQAQATSLHPDTFVKTSDLTEWELGGNLPIGGQEIMSIRVQIDEVRDLGRLVISHPMPHCPAGMACIQVMPAPTVIELPLVSKSNGFCGGEIYVFEKDDTPVDGLRQTLTIYDDVTYFCMDRHISQPKTSVSYTTFNPWTQETLESLFTGHHHWASQS